VDDRGRALPEEGCGRFLNPCRVPAEGGQSLTSRHLFGLSAAGSKGFGAGIFHSTSGTIIGRRSIN
jgi:hypothetical protein